MRIKSTHEENASTWLLERGKAHFHPPEPPPIWFSKRLLVTIVLFFCFINSATITSNVNMAIVEMTSNKSVTKGNVTFTKPPEFAWDSATEGIVLSAFSYGALLSFFGSVPVNIFGGSGSCALAILLMGITTLLQPYTLYISIYLFLICRFLSGLFQAFFTVSAAEIYSRWIPSRERSSLVSYSYNGLNVGFAISTPILGFIAYNYGWKMIFYSTGAASVVLSILCFVLVKNRPSQDKGISKREQLYIHIETSNTTRTNVIHPYRSILLSAPIWALLILQFVISWVPTLMNAYFPIYVKDLTQKETDKVGLISSIPSAAQIIMIPGAGILLDYCKAHTNITTTKIHKIILSIALISSSILYVAIALFSNFTTSLIICVLIQLIISPVHLIVQLITVDIAPNDTSVVAGICTVSQAISNIVSRLITGFMITNHSIQEWNNCFVLMAIVLFIGAIMFLIFGSSEAQWWSLQHHENDEESDDSSS